MQNKAGSSTLYYQYVFSTYVHEIAHAIGAPDHYHEDITDENGIITCRNRTLCYECSGASGRSEWCIMDEGEVDPENYNVDALFCTDCLNDILEHLADYNI